MFLTHASQFSHTTSKTMPDIRHSLPVSLLWSRCWNTSWGNSAKNEVQKREGSKSSTRCLLQSLRASTVNTLKEFIGRMQKASSGFWNPSWPCGWLMAKKDWPWLGFWRYISLSLLECLIFCVSVQCHCLCVRASACASRFACPPVRRQLQWKSLSWPCINSVAFLPVELFHVSLFRRSTWRCSCTGELQHKQL